jgi:cardiolipin synthase (CMP-forming)
MLRHLPNALTVLRLFSAPLLAFLLLAGHAPAALGLLAFAGLTDAADGYVAKRFGLATRFGRYLDPAADKLLMLSAFLALTAIGVTPMWLTALVIGRDLCIVAAIFAARMLALPLRVEPLPIGKVCTAVQVGYVAVVVFFLAFRIAAVQPLQVAAWLAAGFTLASALAYAGLWLKAFSARYRRAT